MAEKKSAKDVDTQNTDSDKEATKRVEDAEARNAEVIAALKTSNDPPRTTAKPDDKS